MQLRKVGVVLLALLLAAMAVVPYVSAEENAINDLNLQIEESSDAISISDVINNYQISGTDAREYAQEALIEAVSLNQFGDSIDWSNAKLSQEHQLIYDLNGEPLFYKFEIEKEGKTTGRIFASANKITGSPVIMVGTAPKNQPSVKQIQETVTDIVNKNFADYTIVSQKPVCYSYPKMGYLVELFNTNTQTRKSIVIDEMTPDEFLVMPDKIPRLSEESPMWSYYNELSMEKITENLKQWDEVVTRINSITNSEEYQSLQGDFTASRENAEKIKPGLIRTLTTGQLKLINYGYFPTTLQLGADFCNIGTAQIITTYYWMVGEVPNVRTQEQIAIKMDAWPDGGPTWANEENYYRDSWANGGLGMDPYRFYFSGPSFTTIAEQVDADQPFKIGLGPHARACYGYDSSVSPIRIYFSDPATGTKYYNPLETYNNHLRMNIPYP